MNLSEQRTEIFLVVAMFVAFEVLVGVLWLLLEAMLKGSQRKD